MEYTPTQQEILRTVFRQMDQEFGIKPLTEEQMKAFICSSVKGLIPSSSSICLKTALRISFCSGVNSIISPSSKEQCQEA